jgi:hypothetical protein
MAYLVDRKSWKLNHFAEVNTNEFEGKSSRVMVKLMQDDLHHFTWNLKEGRPQFCSHNKKSYQERAYVIVQHRLIL